MKLILTSLNSKFIHSCLSIRYLEGMVKDLVETETREYTINQNIDYIVSELYEENPDIIGFSTYIWNLNETLEICEILKKVRPNIKILLGGPEVSYDGPSLMEKNPDIDYIIYGEGEESIREFIIGLKEGKSLLGINGLIYRDEDKIVENPPRQLLKDLDLIPSPYSGRDIGEELENKIIYYESSRGCPFNCKFCLSSTIKGVRYFPLERVKEELGLLIDWKVKQVKFVDRTFNANKKYAMEIMNFIMEKNPENMNFHFEVTAHLLDDEMLDFLSSVKEGLFQFEVGVQSTNEKTIEKIGRTTDFPKLREVTKKIESFGRIHQHLDLIAGLPYEDYRSFGKSFDDVYEIKPEKIQLGFLKLLKGSELREDESLYGFKYLNKPPYEVLENDFISYGDILRIKRIEEMVEKYYNEEYFKYSIDYIMDNVYESAFEFFQDLGDYFANESYSKVSNSRQKLYIILYRFYRDKAFPNIDLFKEVLKLDFVMNNKGSKIPNEIGSYKIDIDKNQIHQLLKDEDILSGYLNEYRDMPTKKLIRNVDIHKFSTSIDYVLKEDLEGGEIHLLFIYEEGVLNRCKFYNVEDKIKEMVE